MHIILKFTRTNLDSRHWVNEGWASRCTISSLHLCTYTYTYYVEFECMEITNPFISDTRTIYSFISHILCISLFSYSICIVLRNRARMKCTKNSTLDVTSLDLANFLFHQLKRYLHRVCSRQQLQITVNQIFVNCIY